MKFADQLRNQASGLLVGGIITACVLAGGWALEKIEKWNRNVPVVYGTETAAVGPANSKGDSPLRSFVNVRFMNVGEAKETIEGRISVPSSENVEVIAASSKATKLPVPLVQDSSGFRFRNVDIVSGESLTISMLIKGFQGEVGVDARYNGGKVVAVPVTELSDYGNRWTGKSVAFITAFAFFGGIVISFLAWSVIRGELTKVATPSS